MRHKKTSKNKKCQIISFGAMAFITYALTLSTAFAQSPQKMSYQAVIRNGSNQLVTNTIVGMQINILQDSASGIAVYTETQAPTTNANGLVTIEIGSGTGFDIINWAEGPYFLKTETDPTGGTNYTITGTSQLLSVPYAMHAKTAENGFSGIYKDLIDKPTTIAGYGITDFDFTDAATNDLLKFNGTKWVKFSPNYLTSEVDSSVTNEIQTLSLNTDQLTISGTGGNTVKFTNWDTDWTNDVRVIGDQTIEGNKTFHGTTTVANPINATDAATKEYVDSEIHIHYIGESYGGGIVFYVYDGGHHGLIADTIDQSSGATWWNGVPRCTGTRGDGLGAGIMNTTLIVATQIGDNPAGDFAAKFCADYSVTIDSITYGDWYLPSKYELNLLYLQKNVVGGFTNSAYWSSTEQTNGGAWYQNFLTGYQSWYKDSKLDSDYVRAIRAF
jgi:hypothetical protein